MQTKRRIHGKVQAAAATMVVRTLSKFEAMYDNIIGASDRCAFRLAGTCMTQTMPCPPSATSVKKTTSKGHFALKIHAAPYIHGTSYLQ